MSDALSCTYCDGETLHSFAAHVELFDDAFLRLTGENFQSFAAAPTVAVSERLGRVPYFLRLPEGGVIELPASREADALVAAIGQPKRLLRAQRWLENRAPLAAAMTLVAALGIGAMGWQALPQFAKRAAHLVRPHLEAEAGLAGYAFLAGYLTPSAPNSPETLRARQAIERLEQSHKFHLTPQVRVVQLSSPNAFALPGGIVILSDALVRLAANDDELLAVLAHELGHVEMRHGLQSVLRNHPSLMPVSTITGDLSPLSRFSSELPVLLIKEGYAPEFEREADAFALELLRKARSDPRALATALQRLEKSQSAGGSPLNYFNTHPSNAERLRLIRENAGRK